LREQILMEGVAAQGSSASNAEPPSVSVISTARNAAATIEATIQSTLDQDFRNWEMIIVDDGSTDATASIVNRFAEADPRIRLIATPGVGRGRALNLALAAARSDLVANITPTTRAILIDCDVRSRRWRGIQNLR
jgi:glycosyltransferase involved in cell wall biosynthesis